VVLAKSGTYQTAFFEAFPKGGGFVRGEGKTLEDAEADAHRIHLIEKGCDHRWGRRDYTNGGAVCVRCNAFQVKFEPIVELGAWKAPLSSDELSSISGGHIRGGLWYSRNNDPKTKLWRRRLWLRAKQAGIDLPPTPEPELEPCFGSDPYQDACMDACVAYYVKERERLRAEHPGASIFGSLLKAFANSGIEREAQRRGLI
jgi:hypothetical protein